MSQNAQPHHYAMAVQNTTGFTSRMDGDRSGLLMWKLADQEEFDQGMLFMRYGYYQSGDIEILYQQDGCTMLYIDVVEPLTQEVLAYVIWYFHPISSTADQHLAPVGSTFSSETEVLLNCQPLHQLLYEIDRQLNGLIVRQLRGLADQDPVRSEVIYSQGNVGTLHQDLLDCIQLAGLH